MKTGEVACVLKVFDFWLIKWGQAFNLADSHFCRNWCKLSRISSQFHCKGGTCVIMHTLTLNCQNKCAHMHAWMVASRSHKHGHMLYIQKFVWYGNNLTTMLSLSLLKWALNFMYPDVVRVVVYQHTNTQIYKPFSHLIKQSDTPRSPYFHLNCSH